MTDYSYPSTANILIISGLGTWGRGRTAKEARKNSGCSKTDQHIVYTFAHDDWEVNGMGDVTWTGESPVAIEFRKGEIYRVSHWERNPAKKGHLADWFDKVDFIYNGEACERQPEMKVKA